MTGVPRGEEETLAQMRAHGHVRTEAETDVMLLQAKEHPGLPEAGREHIYAILSPAFGIWSWQPWKTN